MPQFFSTTVQFPSEEDYRRLKVLAAIRDQTVGSVLSTLVDNAILEFNKADKEHLQKRFPDLWPE